jgi:hypothetical protein
MNLSPILQRFVDKAPLPVMMHAVQQREFDAGQLDSWFEAVAQPEPATKSGHRMAPPNSATVYRRQIYAELDRR